MKDSWKLANELLDRMIEQTDEILRHLGATDEDLALIKYRIDRRFLPEE